MVYILHFNKPYKRCRHYVGYSTDPETRLVEHKTGKGSPLVKAVHDAGIEIQLCIIDKIGTRKSERRIKNQKNSMRFCPICKEFRNVKESV